MWRPADIDYDGRDEIVGRHIVDWDPSTASKRWLWGMLIGHDENQSNDYVHPDHVDALDFLTVYLDANGRLVPSPGIEIIAAPQTSSPNNFNNSDPSGPWIYRSVTGHETHLNYPRLWPRKVMNLNSTGQGGLMEGMRYLFPTSSTSSWMQPDPDSRWDLAGNSIDLMGATLPGPNIQIVLPGNLLSDSAGAGGADTRPGPELLAIAKTSLNDTGGCSDALDFDTHFLFDSTPRLQAVEWDESDELTLSPVAMGAALVDFHGTRDNVEVLAVARQECSSSDRGIIAVFEWQPDGQQGFNLVPLYSRQEQQSGELLASPYGLTSGDVLGDSREEFLYYRLANPIGGHFTKSELLYVHDGDTSVSRTEPPPDAFIRYVSRQRTELSYTSYLDYSSMSGLGLYNRHLPNGAFNRKYGVDQDSVFSSAGKGIVLLPEGGTPPYSVSLATTSDPLPENMSLVDLTGISSPRYAGAAILKGKPQEECSRRLVFTVTDLSGSVEVPLWLTIESLGTFVTDDAPRISGGGFEGAFVDSTAPADVPVVAFVDDNDSVPSNLTVELKDAMNGLVASLAHDSGNRFTGTIDSTYISGLSPGAHFFTIEAEDNDGHKSLDWPFMHIAGGDGSGDPEPVDDITMGQTAAQTPRIEWVKFDRHTVPAAELSDDTGALELTIRLTKPPSGGETPIWAVERIQVQINHHIAGIAPYVWNFIPTNMALAEHTVTVSPPAAEFGFGKYSVNVQAEVRTLSGTQLSDWWPSLTVH